MDGLWYSYVSINETGAGVVHQMNAEKFTTHFENLLRAYLGVPLRESYSESGLERENGRLLEKGTKKSLYHYFYVFIGGRMVPIAPFDYSHVVQEPKNETK